MGEANAIEGELARLGIPKYLNFISVEIAGPCIIRWGTSEQRERFLWPTSVGDIQWCQLFSEPEAGSDLASLSTSAKKDGNRWIVNGQKVWSSRADEATHGVLLARSSPGKPKHKGLTCFVLDMAAPGVEVRPIRTIAGDDHFTEVFLDNVEISNDNCIGPIDHGWEVAVRTLATERTGLAGPSHVEDSAVDGLIANAIENGSWDNDWIRNRLTKLWIRERSLQMTNANILNKTENDSGGASVAKLLNSELQQEVSEMRLDLELHNNAAADEDISSGTRYEFLSHRSLTIAGGTSEIQRNIIAERYMGLPREHDETRDKAWRDVYR